jgi:hypothetical protein
MTTRKTALGAAAVGLLGLLCLRCSMEEGAAALSDSGPNGQVGSPTAATGGSGSAAPGGNTGGSLGIGASPSGGGGGAPPIVVPPEAALEGSFLAPVGTGNLVFSAKPHSGRLAVNDADTYAVALFNAGFGPK